MVLMRVWRQLPYVKLEREDLLPSIGLERLGPIYRGRADYLRLQQQWTAL
jgi:hypothetical protein